MAKKTYKVLQVYSKKQHGKVPPRIVKCMKLLKKGDVFEPRHFIEKHFDQLSSKSNITLFGVKNLVFKTFFYAKKLGIIEPVAAEGMSFVDFCELESVSYFADQLKGSRNRHRPTPKLASTKVTYLYRLHDFSRWLHGRKFTFTKTVQTGEQTFQIKTVDVILDSIEDLLQHYKKSMNSNPDFIKLIKKYLLDKVHTKYGASYMQQKHTAIMSYFEKNECDLKFKYDGKTTHTDFSDISSEALLTLDDLVTMLTEANVSVKDRAMVLCKFHRGLDNLTFCDRFNYEAWEQLVKYFGHDDYDNWDLSLCPVPIRLVRVKTNFLHTGYLERDAIISLQKYLKVREQKNPKLAKGDPIFINQFGRGIAERTMSNLIPKLAKNAGIQNKIKSSNFVQRNEKTTHELRDLLKSTLWEAGTSDYVRELAVGHKIGDSYEKQDKLYPEKSRSEFAKAANRINIFTKISNYISNGDESEKKIYELENKIQQLSANKGSMEKMIQKMINEQFAKYNAPQYERLSAEDFEKYNQGKDPIVLREVKRLLDRNEL